MGGRVNSKGEGTQGDCEGKAPPKLVDRTEISNMCGTYIESTRHEGPVESLIRLLYCNAIVQHALRNFVPDSRCFQVVLILDRIVQLTL